jgi:hypothetical protein
MTSFAINIVYNGATVTQTSSLLTPEQAEEAMGAFLRDMLRPGSAITRIIIETKDKE